MHRENSTDLRVLRTRKAIEQALITLLGKLPLEKITVQDICQEALVNKGTFYRHYHDKYEVASSLARRELARLREQVIGAVQCLAQHQPSTAADFPGPSPTESLIPLRTFEVDGRTVEEQVREIVTDALDILSQAGMLKEDLDTEAWAFTTLTFEYFHYCSEVRRPVPVEDYVRAICEASFVYQKTFECPKDRQQAR